MPGVIMSGRLLPFVALSLLLTGTLVANEPMRLQERFPAGYQYHVSSRVRLAGELNIPADKENPKGQTLSVTGESAIEYDERIVEAGNDEPARTLRVYKRIDFQRKFGKQEQDNTLRTPVRRLVILRQNHAEVPFSPDGPLLYTEIDLVRTDVFTPALNGLLPSDAVKPGDRWKANATAVAELTDLDRIEEGSLECKFEDVVTVAGRKHARISLAGNVRGVNEDGPSRYEINGFFYFDLVSNHLSYLSFKGKHLLLDKDGKANGWNEGTFTLTRQANVNSPDLSDSVVRGIALEPNANNTLLLYDNAELGIKFLYPRRWRIGRVEGRQIMLDDNENKGNGMLITLADLKSTPTPQQFLDEAQGVLKEQKGRILGTQPPRPLQSGSFAIDRFTLEAEMVNQRLLLDYYILRQAVAGATVFARMLPADIQALRPEIEQIARSIVLSTPKPGM